MNRPSFAVLSASAAPTSTFRIIPAGSFKAIDGRPSNGSWHLSDASARSIVAAADARGIDYQIDYEHATLQPGKINPAAGWFKKLEARPDGLYVTDARWTAAAAKMITAGEYRFISPVIITDDSGEVTGLLNIALTNNPALHGLTDLALSAAMSVGLSSMGGMQGQPAVVMCERGRQSFIAAFGMSVEELRSRDAQANALALSETARIEAGFAGRDLTDNQKAQFLSLFGKTPEELAKLYP